MMGVRPTWGFGSLIFYESQRLPLIRTLFNTARLMPEAAHPDFYSYLVRPSIVPHQNDTAANSHSQTMSDDWLGNPMVIRQLARQSYARSMTQLFSCRCARTEGTTSSRYRRTRKGTVVGMGCPTLSPRQSWFGRACPGAIETRFTQKTQIDAVVRT